MSQSGRTNSPLLIHVGYHKTGTTWLQRVLFQPEFGYRPVMEHAEIFDRIVRPHGLCFNSSPVRDDLAARRGLGAPGQVDLISSEILCGNPLNGGRESDVLAYRLKEIAPDAKILLTIREQKRALTSVYMQHLNRCGTLGTREFFADDPVIGYVAFAPEHLEYHRLVSLYRQLFGDENVKVMLQEKLGRAPIEFAIELGTFAGVGHLEPVQSIGSDRMSPSPPEFCAPALRFLNHFRSGPAGLGPMIDIGPVGASLYKAIGALGRSAPVRSLFKGSEPVSREVRRRYGDRYAESNRTLSALIGLDLGAYGYDV